MWRKTVTGAAWAFGCVLGARSAAAASPACADQISRSNVVACALAASLDVRSEELSLEGIENRRTTASTLLPANPTVTVTGGIPSEPSTHERTMLWSASLSQELEVAGQRAARMAVVSAERRAQQARLITARRNVSADALLAYFDGLAATEELRIADRLVRLGDALQAVAVARAQAGVGSSLEARAAEAVAVRLAETRIAAQERTARTRATLATLVGLDPLNARAEMAGELVPLGIIEARPADLVAAAWEQRSDLDVATAERQAQERRVTLLNRSRVPNPTISVFARRDWIGERMFGVGISFPIPLPAPVGRTFAGEIGEATAQTRRREVEITKLRRMIQLEVVKAVEVVVARKQRLGLYTPDRVQQTETALDAIAEEILARRMPVREALIVQQGLIDLLAGYVEARRALCVASVELARAAGLPLDRGAQ